jgi:hypothetical protein
MERPGCSAGVAALGFEQLGIQDVDQLILGLDEVTAKAREFLDNT